MGDAPTFTGDRAVVLGGGGLAGIAYLTGLIAALRGHGVRLEDAVAADQIFSILMGTGVEQRREFIERHALEVTNLDI